ncbi:MAG: Slp family lipoprotein [Deltaproteobacteria bacterium]|nr:Slp family lipoprotein [Deltaproteobacteria bacterium]
MLALKSFFCLISLILLTGCTQVISDSVLKQVNPSIRFIDLRRDPRVYEGQMVLLAGVIVKTTYQPDGKTLIEAYQTQMNFEKRPVNLDMSQGRFLGEYDGFLDSDIYAKGRQVTIAGRFQEIEVMKLGEMDYPYPFLKIEEIHLWEKEEPRIYTDPYPWYPIGAPWGIWGGWYTPYWVY